MDTVQRLNTEDLVLDKVNCGYGIFKNEETLIHINKIEDVADNGKWEVENLDLLIWQSRSVPSRHK